METCRRDVLETLQKLPAECFTTLPGDPCLVIGLRRGMSGYIPLRRKETADEARKFANEMNGDRVTKAQLLAMEIGSCFGWEVPGADPDSYKEES